MALLGAVAAVEAHHSFSAVYDGNKPVTLRGVVSKMGWQNPHAHIYIDVKNPTTGQVVTWEVESAGASNLLRAGLHREDFIGAEVIVKGFLAKDGTPTVNASSFTLVEAKKEFTSDEAAPGFPVITTTISGFRSFRTSTRWRFSPLRQSVALHLDRRPVVPEAPGTVE